MSPNTLSQVKISKGQITIPESLREQYELHDGESILLIPVENGIIVKRVCDMKSLRGSMKEIDVEKASKIIKKLRSKWGLNEMRLLISGIIKKFVQRFFFTKGFDFFERFGLHVLPVHYYSPIPDTRILRRKPELWSRELPLDALDLNISEQKNLLETIYRLFHDEYMAFPSERTNDPTQYYLNNGSFGFVSGQIHYGIIRYFKPEKVIEIGSGYSTLVSLAALRKNATEDYPCEFMTIDPYPPSFIKKDTSGIKQLIAKKSRRY